MEKKKGTDTRAFSELRAALTDGKVGSLYVFTGEEAYLRARYAEKLREAVVTPGTEAFNFHRVEGKNLSVRELAEMTEALPMLAERTMVEVDDFDPFACTAEEREAFADMVEHFPPYCCLLLYFDLAPYKENGTMKRLSAAMKRFSIVEFPLQERGKLIGWVRRHFEKYGKSIDTQTCERLIFTCGEQMATLVNEIEKIAAYAHGTEITAADIRAVATPMTETVVFEMTNAVTAGDFDGAARELGALLRQKEDPGYLLAALGNELRRLYSARLALDSGRDSLFLKDLWGMRSDYPAKLLLSSARNVSTAWCRRAVVEAERLGCRMRTGTGTDGEGELKRFLMELAQESGK